jgi:LysM repeat protein
VNRLMQANGIKDPTLVQIGQRLVIPGRSSSGGSAGGGSSRSGSYTVKSGETLGEIAERYNTSAERLMQLNRISDPTQLQAGSRIVVPGGASRTASRTSAQPVRNAKAREHVVQPGESLSEIADSYNLPVQKLVSLNNISDPNLLMSGTRLRLTAPPPVPASRPAPTPPKAASRPAPKPAARPAPAMTAKPKPVSTTAAPAAPVTATATTPAAAVASRPRVSPTAAATPAAATPRAAAAQAGNQASPQPTTAAATANAPAPQVAVRQTTTPRATAAAATTAAKPVGPDWRTYGPLQVDWANWQPMGGSFVAPSLNAEGQPLYTAINCGARKLNGTTQTGQWRTWEAPRSDSEQKLVTDLCKAKGS